MEAKAPPTPIPPAPVPSAPADRRFVLGSTLNLRAEPDGRVLGKLSINSPVTELETKGAWSRVKVGNGREGWVGTAFLGTKPISVEQAIEKAEETGELSWWQRAAAIAPDRQVLQGLAQAYTHAGKPELAGRVEEQLRWPRQLLLAWEPWNEQPAGHTVVEWSRAGYGHTLRPTVPKAAWRRYGLEEGDVWWVLPSQGPAVQATATRLSQDALNECSGEWSRNLWLEHEKFPEGVVAVAAWRGKPPESWSRDLRPKIDRARAEAAIRGRLTLEGTGQVMVRLAPSGEGWVGYARVENGRYGELGSPLYDEAEVRWMPEKPGVTIGPVHVTSELRDVVTERDVVGSGKVLRVREDGCETSALDGEHEVKSTLYRCCGC